MGYKLLYFNIHGLGEPIRYLLKYGGVEFEDFRVEREQWPGLKESMPLKQLPVLEVDGKRYFQSVAIYRYLGAKFGISGKNLEENLEIDIAIDTFTELRTKISEVLRTPEDKKQEALKTFLDETMPFYLSKLNSMAEDNGGYLACKRLTWVDFVFAAFTTIFTFLTKNPDEVGKYPGLKKVVDNVESIDVIKKWIAERPNSDY